MGMSDEQAAKVGRRIGIGVLLAVLAIGAWALTADPDSDEYEPTTADAQRMCQENVTDKLKAPASARFGGVDTSRDDDTWTVTGWVDAENGFGANLRSDWACEAVHVGDGEWRTKATLDS